LAVEGQVSLAQRFAGYANIVTPVTLRQQIFSSLRFGVLAIKKRNAKPQCRQGAPTETPIRRRTDEARYETALRKKGSPVVSLFDRVEPGKNPRKNSAKKS